MRRGQKSGADAWVLVTLISIAMVGFVMFLPAADRQAILEGTEPVSDGSTTSGISKEVLFEKHVGRLEHYPTGPISHPIASVHLFHSTKSTELIKYNPFSVERAVFSGSPVTKTFMIDNLEHVDNVLLAIDSSERDGTLTILLNGRVIAEISSRSQVAPLTLPRNLLQKQNTLTFDVSSPGWKIWKLHRFYIDNARIFADMTDPAKQQATTTFTLSPVEQSNLLASEMRFTASCDAFTVGALEISVNGRVVYRAIPDCETTNIVNVDSTALVAGTNNIKFQTTEGEYHLDRMRLENDLKPVRTFIEYFEVDPDLMDSVDRGGKDVYLEVDFVDDTERKRAELNMNGHLSGIDQREPFYARNINSWLRSGMRNYIEIIPESPLNIVEVRVVVR